MLDAIEKMLTDAQRFGLTPSVDPVAESLQALERMTGVTVTAATQPTGVETPVLLAEASEKEQEQKKEREDGDEWAIFGGTANVGDPRDLARHPMRPVPLPKYDKSADLPGGADDKYVGADGDDTTMDYLDAKLDATTDAGVTAADHWIRKKVLPGGANNNKVTLNHGDACSTVCTCICVAGAGSVSGSGHVEIDEKGHVVNSDTITLTGTDEYVKVEAGGDACYLDQHFSDDNTWIQVQKDTGKMDVSHIGPGAQAHTSGSAGACGWIDDMSFDAKGHMRWISLCSWPSGGTDFCIGPCV